MWDWIGCRSCFPLTCCLNLFYRFLNLLRFSLSIFLVFPIMTSVYGVEFLQYFAFVFGSEKLEGVDADLQSILTQLDGCPFSKIHALKEFGNSLFRAHQFALAGECYDQACRQLGVTLKDNFELDLASIISLAVSLCLNLAACPNKIQAFDGALIFCTMVLTFFPKNAKGLFRKAVAFTHLNRLSEANVTLKEAQVLEPHNKDIIRELEIVRQALKINHNGKRVVVNLLDDTEVPAGKKCASSLQAPEVGLVTNIDYAPVSSPVLVVPTTSLDSASSSEPTETFNIDADCFSSSSTNLKSSHFTFTDKKRPHNTLKLSSQDYENILHGKSLGFYHPRSMSFMRVCTLTSKTIQTGTPHEEISGTAEVPVASPEQEIFVQEKVKLVQEEVVFQVDKKTRLTSASSCVSKVSLVEFNFTAVREHREHLHNSREACRPHGKARMGRPTVCSKKRYSVPVKSYTFLQVHSFHR